MSVDERKLIGQVLAGRTEEFGYFLEKYGRQVLALVSRLVSQQMDAEEVAQDAFVNAHSNHLLLWCLLLFLLLLFLAVD